jgi:hypothetical protein
LIMVELELTAWFDGAKLKSLKISSFFSIVIVHCHCCSFESFLVFFWGRFIFFSAQVKGVCTCGLF